MLDLHRLRLLRELKHRGTLAAVAAALSYSPSSISQQLAVLEREAGVPLLEPVGRRVRLTPQAEILVAHTEAVLERLERAEADLAASLAGITGVLRIAAFQTVTLALVPAALTSLRRAHPRLRVEVAQHESERALPALLARDFDLVVTEEYPGDPVPRPAGVEYEALGEDEIRLALPEELSVSLSVPPRTGVALDELADQPWVMEPAGTAARRWATGLCRDAGFEPDVRFESTDLLLHLRLVERGHAAALLPDLVWSGDPRGITVLPLPVSRRARRIFTATRRGGGAHPAVRACREALSAAFGGRS
ncbi:LysR family transcriptional regulator [Actinomadura roseirufa]|uniref:LysR family transcriptional regulator n=1 Tax=Actinomadura roseirufa TaxID=2094049 RepID=UPI00104136D2|nr:LysR family transcriptional regulator [Actinomadura roseirufa]